MPSVFDDPENYPAISLWQPWAGLIWLAGMGYEGKDIETRPRRILFVGPLVICAGRRCDNDHWFAAWERLVKSGRVPDEVFRAACNAHGVALSRFDVKSCRAYNTSTDADRAFVQTVPTFAKRRRHVACPPAPPRWAWLSSQIAALQPFDVHGAQGFFRVPRGLVDRAVITTTPTPP